MATSAQMFLRLPSSLRQHMLLQEPARLGQLLRVTTARQNISRRTFQTTAKLYKRKATKVIPKQTPSQPPASIPYHQTSKAPTPRASSPRAAPPKALESEPLDVDREPLTVLLYTSTNHGAFFSSSIIIGSAFIFGAYLYSQTVLKDTTPDGTKQGWYYKLLGAASALPLVGFGTLFVLAPQKMIKSIAVVSKDRTVMGAVGPASRFPRFLRIEIKRIMPFAKPDIMEAKVQDVALDRNVPMTLRDLNFASVSKEDAMLWTEDYFTGKWKPDSGPTGVLAAVKGFWPGTKREVRRIFLRDQMARVHVENNGTFKLDLRKCCMLDEGLALSDVLGNKVMEDMSLTSRLAALVRS